MNEETRCPWNTISLSFLGHLDFPYSTGNAGIMDVPAEAEWSMDATFRRLPEKRYTYGKF